MIAVAFAKVDRANGRKRYRSRRLAAQLPAAARCLFNWLKPSGQGTPPLSGPITNGIGPLRKKNAKGLGYIGTIGRMRSATSNSPARIRVRSCLHARHSNAIARGNLTAV